ncbi:MAG: biopolymer transporter ExbD [Acidaminococcales bacterium]|nr:biopolymer transporter ExbD [Acidaminococcales bacterium]
MRMRETRIVSTPKLMIVPLIDIIFSILVFFIVVTMQMVYQKNLPVQLPVSEAAQRDKKVSLVITIQRDGKVSVGDETVAAGDVAGRVKGILARQPETDVIIRADKKVEHGSVVEIMGQLKNVGVTRLAIAVEEKGDS